MKEKIKRLTKKKWFTVTAALIVLGLILYGAGRLVYAEDYGVVTWDGDFQYSQDNWKYSTKSYIVVEVQGDSLILNANENNNGVTRKDSTSGNTKELEVNQTQLVQYLRDVEEYTFHVGEVIEWDADAKVTFKYSGVKTVTAGPWDNIEEAYDKNERDWSTFRRKVEDRYEEVRNSENSSGFIEFDGTPLIDWPEDNIGGIAFMVQGKLTPLWYGYLHKFEDGGYWKELGEGYGKIVIREEDLYESSRIDIYFQDEYGSTIAAKDEGTGTVGSSFSYTAESTIESDGNIYTLDSWVYESDEDSGSGTGSTAKIDELKSTSYTITFTYSMVEVEEHECTYEWGNYNDTYHWYICTECGKSSEKHAHQMVAGESDPDTGETVYTCECSEHEECPYSYVKHKHSFVGWIPDEDDSYPIEDWEEDYKYNPNEYHWKYCEYDDCASTSGRASHSAGDWEDDGDGYERKRCKTCGFVMEERAITVNILLNPNGGTFPDGSTEMIEIGPFVYGKATELSVLTDANYFPAMEGKDFFGYYVVEEGLSEAFYKPNWELSILEGQPYFFGTNSNGETYSKIKKAYTVHAQYREPSYEIEYHPMNDLAVPQTMAKSHHDVGKESKLSLVGFYITIPIGYEIGTVAGNVETTADNTFHAAEFLGWATTEERALEGIVDYEDEATVLNLLTHAGTFHLYAVWDYGSIILPNAKSANGGMKLKGWTNSDGDFYSVLDSTGNYTGTATYQLSGRAETMTAEWIPNTYTVSFNANGGTDCVPIEVTYLGTYGTLPETTKKGNTFAGWVNDITGETVYSSTIVTLAGDHTLSAKWNPNPITVTLEYCFDSVGTSENYGKYATNAEKDKLTVKDNDTDTFVTYYNEFYSVLSTPFIDGYTFAGWYTEKGADGCGCGHSGCLVSNNTRISNTENHSVYAKWTEKQYKIYLDTNQDYTVEE